MKGNRLLSGGRDCLIKVWTLSNDTLTLDKTINEHRGTVNKVISLSQERFGSCSYDYTTKIFKDDNTYSLLGTLDHYNQVQSIIQLKGIKY